MIHKDIPGFEGLYSVSDTGEVICYERSVPMPNGGFKIIKKHKPKLSITRKGYFKVMLTDRNGNRKGFFVHRLVLLTFIGSSDLPGNHKDRNKKNNMIENLEYVTNRMNTIHGIDKTKTSSQLIGVTAHQGKWQAQKMIRGKQKYLGIFTTEQEAHDAYEKA
jgi:hypothetical protein